MKQFVNGELVDMDHAEAAALQAEWDAAPPPPQKKPVTRRQLRLTLLAHGYLDHVEPAIADLPEPLHSEATIEWQDASEYHPDHWLVARIGLALGLSEPQSDALWLEAMAR